MGKWNSLCQGYIGLVLMIVTKNLSLDIYKKSKLDISESLSSIWIQYLDYDAHGIDDSEIDKTAMKEFLVDTKAIYPSDMQTFRLDTIVKGKIIRWLTFYINLTEDYDVDILLEDSKRSIINSEFILWSSFF